MYSIPLTINNRREWMAELTSRSHQESANNFIVEISKTSYFNLLSIDPDALLRAFQLNAHDLKFDQLVSSCTFDGEKQHILIKLTERLEPNTVVIPKKENVGLKSFYDDLDEDLKPTPKEIAKIEPPIFESESVDFSVDFDFQYQHQHYGIFLKVKLKYPISDELFQKDKFLIKLEYEQKEVTFSKNIVIYFCHPTQYLGMALDFGSEASQMVVSRFGAKGNLVDNPVNEDLFQKIKDYHVNKNWIENTQVAYYQEEKNTPFYKSIFFLKTTLGSEYENFADENYIVEQGKHLKMLVDRSNSKVLMEQQFKQLPNLKITHRQDNILSNIKFQYHDKQED